jgi:hypothetical protein
MFVDSRCEAMDDRLGYLFLRRVRSEVLRGDLDCRNEGVPCWESRSLSNRLAEVRVSVRSRKTIEYNRREGGYESNDHQNE